MMKFHSKKGFSLVEMLIVLFILSLFVVLVGDFQAKVFTFNSIFSGANDVGFSSNSVLRPMVSELRSMSPSSLGSYPIELAATNTVIFYNDLNDDGTKERERYFLAGTTLKKGVIIATGTPLSYSGTEAVTILASNVRNAASNAIFSYYDSGYNGSASSTEPMVQPVSVQNIRLIRITLVLDNNTNQPLVPVTVTSVASLRNLKDNL